MLFSRTLSPEPFFLHSLPYPIHTRQYLRKKNFPRSSSPRPTYVIATKLGEQFPTKLSSPDKYNDVSFRCVFAIRRPMYVLSRKKKGVHISSRVLKKEQQSRRQRCFKGLFVINPWHELKRRRSEQVGRQRLNRNQDRGWESCLG